MQRSSESIAALAAALAKAQIELINPEKSLTGPSSRMSRARGTDLPLCLTVERARYRAQDARASMRSPPCRPPRSIRRPASSI